MTSQQGPNNWETTGEHRMQMQPLESDDFISWDNWRLGAKFRFENYDLWSNIVKVPRGLQQYLEDDRISATSAEGSTTHPTLPVSSVHDGLDMLFANCLKKAKIEHVQALQGTRLENGNIFLPASGDLKMKTTAAMTTGQRRRPYIVLPLQESYLVPYFAYRKPQQGLESDEDLSLVRRPMGIVLTTDDSLLLAASACLPDGISTVAVTLPVPTYRPRWTGLWLEQDGTTWHGAGEPFVPGVHDTDAYTAEQARPTEIDTLDLDEAAMTMLEEADWL